MKKIAALDNYSRYKESKYQRLFCQTDVWHVPRRQQDVVTDCVACKSRIRRDVTGHYHRNKR